MSNLTNDQIMDAVHDTLAWAREIAEMWTGTQHEKLIDAEEIRVLDAVQKNDLEHAYKLICDLAQTLDYAEQTYE